VAQRHDPVSYVKHEHRSDVRETTVTITQHGQKQQKAKT
jgi:hypothetical protein